MSYSPSVLSRAKARLADEKREAESEYARRLADAYSRFPRLKAIDIELRSTMAETMAACFQKGGDPQAAIASIRDRNLALQREREWILEAADLEPDYLEARPVCVECSGLGYVGERMCACLKELCRQEQKKELTSLLSARASFEHFSLDWYAPEFDPDYGVSPRENMRRVLRDVRSYALGFTPGQSGSMLFSGGTGLGKTFLSACVARTVADLGASVVYDTAVAIFNDFETEKFRRSSYDDAAEPPLTDKYLKCDLLIIDDLGTELTTNFTQSALYTIINNRLLSRRATIISTNLSMTDISARYSPQIVSRLKGTYEDVYFFGQDIRQQKKNASY